MGAYSDWTTEAITKVANQIATVGEHFGASHFKSREALNHADFAIPIYRGNSVVMEATPRGAPRRSYADATEHKISASLARFAEEKRITPADIRGIKSIASDAGQEEAYDALVARRMAEMKNRIVATMEHLRVGAILGEVKDGNNNTLFKFDSGEAKHEFKSKNPRDILDQISEKIAIEFGRPVGFKGYVSSGFFAKIQAYADEKDLWKKDVVRRENVKLGSGDEVRAIIYEGIELIPVAYGAGKNLVDTNEAVFVPNDEEAFREYYTNAEHMKAMQMAPQEYFSDIVELEGGDGLKIIMESVKLPVCIRPYAIRRAVWSN